MRRYWDSSALIEAFQDSRVEALAIEPDQWTRPHALTECFSTLTGGRLGSKLRPSDVAAMLRELTANMGFVELDGDEIQEGLDLAEKRGVRGGRVHDWMHARAATKSGAVILYTLNLGDFAGLEDGFRVEAP